MTEEYEITYSLDGVPGSTAAIGFDMPEAITSTAKNLGLSEEHACLAARDYILARLQVEVRRVKQ